MALSRKPVPDRANCMRYRGGECTLCRDACPAGALTLDDGPVLDQGRCRGCGICAAVCPTEALHHEAARDLLQALPRLPDRREAAAACFSIAPGADTLRLDACLSCLTIADLVHIAALGVGHMRFVHGNCAACSLGDGGQRFAAALTACEQLLSGVAESTSFTSTPAARGAGPVSSPALSRRGFLGLIGAGLRPRHEKAAEAGLALVRTQGRQEPLAQRVSLHRDLCRLRPAGHGAAPVPIAGLELRGDCQACAACARICPTGALEFTDHGAEFSLRFSAWKCIDCGLCRTACRAGCLVRLPAGLEALLDDRPTLLASGRLSVCKRCGAKSALPGPGDFCPLCTRRLKGTTPS